MGNPSALCDRVLTMKQPCLANCTLVKIALEVLDAGNAQGVELMSEVRFTAFVHPEPQGSTKGFVLKGKWGAKDRAILTSSNPEPEAVSWTGDKGSGCGVRGRRVPAADGRASMFR